MALEPLLPFGLSAANEMEKIPQPFRTLVHREAFGLYYPQLPGLKLTDRRRGRPGRLPPNSSSRRYLASFMHFLTDEFFAAPVSGFPSLLTAFASQAA